MATVDDYMKNDKWVARIQASFDVVDLNKNGTVEMDDWKRWIENIKRDVNPDAKLVDNLNKAMTDYTEAMGVTEGVKLNKDQYVEALAKLAVMENAKRAKGEATLRDAVNTAWYDAVDKNHDGNVTLDEFRAIMKACNVKEEIADARFSLIDTNKNGKIDRKELTEFQYKFWFGLDN